MAQLTEIVIKWGANVLKFTRDAQIDGIYHSGNITVEENFLSDNPKNIFMNLIELGLLKPNEVKF